MRKLGYYAYWHSGTRSRGGYGGTLFFSLVQPEALVKGTGSTEIDSKGRFMALIFADMVVVNTYAPILSMELEGKKRKTAFWAAAVERYTRIINKFKNRPTVWVGDMNVAPLEKDAHSDGIQMRLLRSYDGTPPEERVAQSDATRETRIGEHNGGLRLSQCIRAATGSQ